jgi:hypothetical protein
VLHPTTHAHHLGIIQHPTSIRVDISAYPLHPPIKIPGKSIPYPIQLAKKTIFAERKKKQIEKRQKKNGIWMVKQPLPRASLTRPV